MGRYDEDYSAPAPMRQKDLVLSTNEFVFIQSKTNGQIKTYTGPIMVTISAQESMVVFNPRTKKFEETADFEVARQLFTSAPEGWYVVLKNPAKDGTHPDAAKAMNSPELNIGKKINVAGPCSFSLYPGQMAKVIRGHRLRSNQYLIARVYDADAAAKSDAIIVDADGKAVVTNASKYFVGQLLVIKGTEVSFYMPPTGIEVLAVGKEDGKGGAHDTYVRDAVTLERLEYVILKDESGSKRYVSGPSVVFPEPTETFVEASNKNGGVIFRALELSPISGIYVKVIADYKEGDVLHKTGEELFITGKDQMIYYPRPEHALIQYDGKYMHHAIAIPEGEGRYVLNRLTGDIKTVTGPAMYLPDPRYEVVVKRKLSAKECTLLYPGNKEVLEYNTALSEQAIEKLTRSGKANAVADAINCAYSTSNSTDSLAIFEATANISRGVSYTKPRTITLDTKFDGVVSVSVWTGYALNVVSKSGHREIVVGPATRLLNYDESVEAITLSTGRPKNTERTLTTAFLQISNNKVSDVIYAQTSDYVDVAIEVYYSVSFLKEYKDKWFSMENYVKYMTDFMRNKLKRTVKEYSVRDFYSNSTEIVRNCILGEENKGYLFEENGMFVSDVEILSVGLNREISNMITAHQKDIIAKTMELDSATAKMKVIEALDEAERKKATLEAETQLYRLALDQKYEEEKIAKEEALREKARAAKAAEAQAKSDLQPLLTAISEAELQRVSVAREAEIAHEKQLAAIEQEKQKAYADTVEQIVKAISPDLVAALSTKANADLLTSGMSNMAPYAIANGESVAETVNRLLRGTSLEGILDKMAPQE